MEDDKKQESTWSQLTRLFRNGPIVRHKVSSSSNLHEPEGTARAYRKELSSLYVNSLASYGQYERLARYCLDGDTQIATTSGFKTIKELAEEFPDGGFYTFSYDKDLGKIVPARASKAWKTKTAETVKIKFDRGKELICTPDHKVMLRDGTYKEAADLKPGDSCMPFYNKNFYRNGYRFIHDIRNGWVAEHKLVSAHFDRDCADDEVVHHKNFNPADNHPDNLCIMNRAEHTAYHAKVNNKFRWATSEQKAKQSALMKEWNKGYWTEETRAKHSRAMSEYFSKPGSREKTSQAIKNKWVSDYDRLRETINPFVDYWSGKKRPESFKASRRAEKNAVWRADVTIASIEKTAIESNYSQKSVCKKLSCLNKLILDRLRRANFKNWNDFVNKVKERELANVHNHKVVEVISFEVRDVYDIEVPNYHNFATDAILVHNSDYQEMEFCVKPDTLIAVPDGFKTIKELSELYGLDEEFIVFSYDHDKQEIVPALAKQARKTRSEHTWKVVFDNGKTISCTEDHRLMLRDGSYRRVKDLKSGDAMMPFYSRSFRSPKGRFDPKHYQYIYAMTSRTKNGWIAGHKLIAEWEAGREMMDSEVVHHKNFKKFDNSPENLVIMDAAEHSRLHRIIYNKDHKWNYEKNSEWIEGFKKQHSKFMTENNPAERRDITFAKILQVAENNGFNLYKTCEDFNSDPPTIKRRLKKYSFKNWETFAKAYNDSWKNHGWDNTAEKNPRWDDSLTFQMVCDAWESGMKGMDLVRKLNVTPAKIKGRVKQHGFKSTADFCSNYDNCKVVSVEYDGFSDVYDMTVDKYKNFATDSVISHNTPEIASALNIFADEVTNVDENGFMLKVVSDDEEIKQVLETLYFDILNIEFNLHSWVRNLVKNGDFVLFVDASETNGILNLLPIPINEIEREEGYDPKNPFAFRFRWLTQGNMILEAWQIIHFRMLGNDSFLPYGSSIIEPARRIWRQLILIEDAMLVYRIVRSPERRVFKIEMGNIKPEDVPKEMEIIQTRLRRNKIVDQETGRVDLRYNPLSVDEDYWLPMRDGKGSDITTLPGGSFTGDIEDVQYIQAKLFSALQIPKAYLGYEGDVGCLRWNTKVKTLSGESFSIPELISRREAGIKDYIYSGTKGGKVMTAPIKNVWPTKQVNSLIRVTLDNGEIVETTDNHLFMLRDGSFKRADELTERQSLMPFYSKLSSKTGGDFANGYEKILDNETNEWKFTHRLVSEQLKIGRHESADKKSEGWNVVHHVDADRLNNDPSNLLVMGRKAHALHHAEGAKILQSEWSRDNLRAVMKTDKYKEKHLAGVQSAWDNAPDLRRIKLSKANVKNNKAKKMLKAFREKLDSGEISFAGDKNPRFKTRPSFDDIATVVKSGKYKIADVKEELNASFAGLNEVVHAAGFPTWGHMTSVYDPSPVRQGRPRRLREESIALGLGVNHKIVSIEVIQLDEPEWVYDLEVERRDDSNIEPIFALESGIYVHNSKATLAQEDVRFSRTIQRIQKVVLSELMKIAVIHLFLLGYRDEDLVDYEIKMANPSTIAEQQKLELWRMRLEIAGMAQEGMLDKESVWKDLFHFSEDKIETVKDGMRFDKMFQLELEAMTAEPSTEEDEAPPEDDLAGEDELPDTLGGDMPGPEGLEAGKDYGHEQNDDELVLDMETDLLVDGEELEEKRNPGSENTDSEVSVMKGKNFFAPSENLYNHVFGTEKQTASDPFDTASMKRMVTRPFSEASEEKEELDPVGQFVRESLKMVSSFDDEMSNIDKMLTEIKVQQRKKKGSS